MTINLSFSAIFLSLFFLSIPSIIHSLGSGSTLSISSSTSTVCGIVAGETNRRIECFKNGRLISIQPNVSYDAIVGGGSFFCGLRSGGRSLLCWDTSTNSSTFPPKRIYFSYNSTLREISVGDTQVCGIVNGTNEVKCWRGMMGSDRIPSRVNGFQSISSGFGFSCGILMNNSRVICWGSNETLASEIESQFRGFSMVSLTAGWKHVCGFNSSGFLVCKGMNVSNQLVFPPNQLNQSFGFSSFALGLDYSCGIRQINGSVVCWGENGAYSSNLIQGISFEFLVGGMNFVCGLISKNSSIICWGPGWNSSLNLELPLPRILPGPCVQSLCNQCGIYPESQSLCLGDGNNICRTCTFPLSLPPLSPEQPPVVLPPASSPSRSKGLRRGLLAFAIVGSIGAFAGICTIVYCLYTGVLFGRKKIHNSVQPTITRGGSNNARNSSNSPPSRSLTIRRQGSLGFRRQRSGTSSTKHADRAEEFTFQELAAATDDFSWENKIGSGSFGVVYMGKLADGRVVAIKRGETGPRTKKSQEKESAFDSELAFLSRVHHKHLVRLVGYCEERDERLLVYDYMKNGALYDHLHDKNNVEKGNSVVNAWKIRIKIALDAARGIEYLHNYAVPPIIHRDIKSSNILLDVDWTARVSDFGLSLLGPESAEQNFRPTKAAGTVGYIDPEYYSLNVLTAKSDVYGFGVVLLELLTGKKAIFKDESGDGDPISVVDYAVPLILAGELLKILDPRVGPPESKEAEAVELVAYTALHCVNLEGKDRPTMNDIVANLERASSHCDDSYGSISSAGIVSLESD